MEQKRNYTLNDFFDGIEQEEPFYLRKAENRGKLPPQSVDTGQKENKLKLVSMPKEGELLTCSKVYVAPTQLADIAPYVVGIGSFGEIRITGQLRDFDNKPDIGQEIKIDIEHIEDASHPVIVFYPA